ncbi:MAG: hypothetical protein IPH18_01680 [Chitinophagaceae bacterium]|nr:hypothetical protein [Chitinophagaceae bacterium]
MLTGQIQIFDSLGWAVINSLWQIGLLWLIYKFLIKAFSISGTTAKVRLSSTLLFTGFSWFIATLVTSHLIPGAIPGIHNVIIPDENTTSLLQKVLPYSSAIYLVLLIIPVLQFIKNYRYVQVIRQHGISRPDAIWRVFVQKVAAQMNIKKRVQVFVSAFVHSPVTIGFLKPVILLPLAAINNLTAQQTEALLLHELTHIRRHDYLMNFAIQFIRTVLYFNPFVNAFVQIIEKEREKNCDEMVLQYQYSRHEYASALLQLQQSRQPVFFLAAAGEKESLYDRINLILGIPQKNTRKIISRHTLLAFLFCGLFVFEGVWFTANKQNDKVAADSVSLTYSAPALYTTANNFSDDWANRAGKKAEVVSAGKQNETITTLPEEDVMPVSLPADNTGLQFVNYRQVAVPVLKKYQEKLVKSTVDASRKIIEELQWKQVEKNLAEVFTAEEKKELHRLYAKEVKDFDWGQWENRLRIAFDKVDWETVNDQLIKTANQVRIDSLQTVYNEALTRLNKAETVLIENNKSSVPDTDISIRSIGERKEKINSMLDSLRSIRSRKIINL